MLSYVMKKKALSFEDALKFMEKRYDRPCPNEGNISPPAFV